MERYKLRTMLRQGLSLPYRQSVVLSAIRKRDIGFWRSLFYLLPQMLIYTLLVLSDLLSEHAVATGEESSALVNSLLAGGILTYGTYVAMPLLVRVVVPWAKVVARDVRQAYVAQSVMMVEWYLISVVFFLVLSLALYFGLPRELFVVLISCFVLLVLVLLDGAFIVILADLVEVQRSVFVLMTLVGPGILLALMIALRALADRFA